MLDVKEVNININLKLLEEALKNRKYSICSLILEKAQGSEDQTGWVKGVLDLANNYFGKNFISILEDSSFMDLPGAREGLDELKTRTESQRKTIRRQNDPEYKAAVNRYNRELAKNRRQNNPDYRAAHNRYNREWKTIRRHNDQEYKAEVNTNTKEFMFFCLIK